MQSKQKFQANYLPILIAILLFLIKMIIFTDKDLGHDEPFAVWYAQQEIREFLPMLLTANYGILYETLLHYWILLGGIELTWLRIFPLLFSCISIWFIYKIAYKLGGLQAALVSVTLSVFSTDLYYYGFEIRAYSMYICGVVASAWFFMQLCDSNIQRSHFKRNTYFTLVFLTNLILLYTHFFSAFFVFFELLSGILIYRKEKSKVKQIFLQAIGLFIGFLPIIVIVLQRFFDAAHQGTFLDPVNIFSAVAVVKQFMNQSFVLLCLLICLLPYFVFLAIRNKNAAFLVLLFSFILAYLCMFFLSFKIPMFVSRYLLFFGVGCYLFLGIGLAYIAQIYKKFLPYSIGLSVIICAVQIFEFSPDPRNNYYYDYTHAVQYIKQQQKNPCILYNFRGDKGFEYAYDQEFFKDYKQIVGDKGNYKLRSFFNLEEITPSDTSKYKQLIFIQDYYEFKTPYNQFYDKFKQYYPIVSADSSFEKWLHVTVFETTSCSSTDSTKIPQH